MSRTEFIKAAEAYRNSFRICVQLILLFFGLVIVTVWALRPIVEQWVVNHLGKEYLGAVLASLFLFAIVPAAFLLWRLGRHRKDPSLSCRHCKRSLANPVNCSIVIASKNCPYCGCAVFDDA